MMRNKMLRNNRKKQKIMKMYNKLRTNKKYKTNSKIIK